MTNEELIKINTAAHKFGHFQLDSGIKWIRIAHKLQPRCYTRGEILLFLSNQLGLPTSTLSLADEKYYVETWSKWIPIIDYDLIDQQVYLSDIRDCDNFAAMYSARASFIYGLNSCGLAYGNIYDLLTKKLLFRHAFNLIIYHENGALKLRLYEPQTDSSIEWRKGQSNVIPQLKWEYRPDWVLLQ